MASFVTTRPPGVTSGYFSHISEITSYLYLCGVSALNNKRVKELGVTSIISATMDKCHNHGSFPGVQFFQVFIDDTPQAKLIVYFDQVADRIRQIKLRGGRVIVHCMAGVSRSASLCIAYLMKYEAMSLREAYFYVRRRRMCIRPNIGFWHQLIDYEKQLRGVNSVTILDMGINGYWPDVYKEELKNMVMAEQPSTSYPSFTSTHRRTSRSSMFH